MGDQRAVPGTHRCAAFAVREPGLSKRRPILTQLLRDDLLGESYIAYRLETEQRTREDGIYARARDDDLSRWTARQSEYLLVN